MKIHFSKGALHYAAIIVLAWSTGPLPTRGALVAITDLFNTGLDASRAPLPDDAIDPHYNFTQFAGGPPPLSAAPIVATSATGFPVAPAGPWIGDNSLSAWITPALDTTGNAGNYTYSTTFTLPSGIDLSQVFVTGVWASDNDGVDILINGLSTGIRNTTGFAAYSPQWAIGSGFVAGTNTLDFVVNEATGSAGAGGYTGLRVEMSGQFTSKGVVPIPGLENSGVASPEGPALADDSVSPGVVLTGAISGNAIVARGTAGFPIPPWTPDSRDSAWVTPSTDTNGPDGDYAYSITFDLTGLNPNTVSIIGRWAVDNTGGDILLNGQSTGKDSTIKHVMSGVNPQGCSVCAFKAPSPQEQNHDFLWRSTNALPERGRIGIFNRSYYEEVLVVRVRPDLLAAEKLPAPLVTKRIWEQRFDDINDYERHLTRSGIVVRKFFLHVSKKEQKKRFLERLDEKSKNWKFAIGDLRERERWDYYMDAYEEMVQHTATADAPWYVVPADNKWFTRLIVAAAIVDTLKSLDLQFPKVTAEKKKELAAARAALNASDS